MTSFSQLCRCAKAGMISKPQSVNLVPLYRSAEVSQSRVPLSR